MLSLFGLELTAVLEVRADIEDPESIEADRGWRSRFADRTRRYSARAQKASADSGPSSANPSTNEIPMDELGETAGAR